MSQWHTWSTMSLVDILASMEQSLSQQSPATSQWHTMTQWNLALLSQLTCNIKMLSDECDDGIMVECDRTMQHCDDKGTWYYRQQWHCGTYLHTLVSHALGSPGTGVTGNRELSCGCWEPSLVPEPSVRLSLVQWKCSVQFLQMWGWLPVSKSLANTGLSMCSQSDVSGCSQV